MVKSKKGNLVTTETLELILAVAVVLLLVFLLARLFMPSYNRSVEVSKSYVENLAEQIDLADKGFENSFSFWLPVKDHQYYVVYFGTNSFVRKGLMAFSHIGNNQNLLCVCYKVKKADHPVCEDCFQLNRPAIFKKDNSDKWIIEQGSEIKISVGDGKYVFDEV